MERKCSSKTFFDASMILLYPYKSTATTAWEIIPEPPLLSANLCSPTRLHIVHNRERITLKAVADLAAKNLNVEMPFANRAT